MLKNRLISHYPSSPEKARRIVEDVNDPLFVNVDEPEEEPDDCHPLAEVWCDD